MEGSHLSWAFRSSWGQNCPCSPQPCSLPWRARLAAWTSSTTTGGGPGWGRGGLQGRGWICRKPLPLRCPATQKQPVQQDGAGPTEDPSSARTGEAMHRRWASVSVRTADMCRNHDQASPAPPVSAHGSLVSYPQNLERGMFPRRWGWGRAVFPLTSEAQTARSGSMIETP